MENVDWKSEYDRLADTGRAIIAARDSRIDALESQLAAANEEVGRLKGEVLAGNTAIECAEGAMEQMHKQLAASDAMLAAATSINFGSAKFYRIDSGRWCGAYKHDNYTEYLPGDYPSALEAIAAAGWLPQEAAADGGAKGGGE